MSVRRYWDMFYRGRWIGMAAGVDLSKAVKMAERGHPGVKDQIKYAEWFGRNDERNCITSGGKVSNP